MFQLTVLLQVCLTLRSGTEGQMVLTHCWADVMVTSSPGPEAARPSQLSLELWPSLRTVRPVRPDVFCLSLSDIKMGGILVWQIWKNPRGRRKWVTTEYRATRCTIPCFMAGINKSAYKCGVWIWVLNNRDLQTTVRVGSLIVNELTVKPVSSALLLHFNFLYL